MANRIKGITIDINGNTTGLDKALKTVNNTLKTSQSALKDTQKLMQFSKGTDGIKLWRQQQEELRKSIDATKEKLKTLKTASEQAAKTRGNYKKWAEEMKPIQTALTETQDKIKNAQIALKRMEKSGKVDTAGYKKLKKELEKLQAEAKQLNKAKQDVDKRWGKPISPEGWNALQREIIATNNDLRTLQRQASPTQQALKKIGKAAEAVSKGLKTGGAVLSTAGGKISGVADGILGKVRSVTTTITKTTGDALKTVGNLTSTALTNIGSVTEAAGTKVTALAGALDGALVGAVKQTADFDSTMAAVRATSGATDEEFEALRDAARKMGKESKYSAAEAAEALKYMAMAGWDAQEMMDALQGTIQLSTAGGADLGTTSDIMTDTMTALHMSADQANHFADVIASSAANSNTSIEIMGETFKNSASIAGALGYSLEDVATAVGLMANAGVKGSIAGTALRNTFQGLLDGATLTAKALGEEGYQFTAIKDDGSLKDFSESLEELREVFGKMTNAEKVANAQLLAGARGYNGLLGIIDATQEDYDKLKGTLNDCTGAAANMSKVMGDTLTGDTLRLKSAVGELAIQYGDILTPKLRETMQKLTGVIEYFQAMPVETKNAIIKVAAALSILGPALIIVGKLTSSIGLLIPSLGRMVTGWVATAAVVGGLVLLFRHLYQTNDAFRGLVDEYLPRVKEAFNGVKDTVKGALESVGVDVDGLVNKVVNVKDTLYNSFSEKIPLPEIDGGNIVSKFTEIKEKVLSVFREVWPEIKENLGIIWDTIKETAPIIWDVYKNDVAPVFKSLLDWFRNLSPETKRMIVKITAFAVAFSPLLKILGSVMSIGGGILTGISGIARILPLLISPAGGVAMAIGLIGFALYEIIKHWDEIKETFFNALDWWKDLFSSIGNAISGAFESAKDRVLGVANSIKDGFSERFGRIKDAVESHGGGITGAIAGVFATVRQIWTDEFNLIDRLTGGKLGEIVGVIQSKIGQIVGWFSEIPGKAIAWGQDLIQSFISGINMAFDKLKETITKIWNWITEHNPLNWITDKIGELTGSNSYQNNMKAMGTTPPNQITKQGPTYNGDNVYNDHTNITINASEGQSVDELYDTFNRRLAQDAIKRRKAMGWG